MTQIQETFKALNAQWDAVFNAKDANAVAASYDMAAAVIPAGAPQVSGQASILEFWKGAIAQGITDHKLDLIEVGVSGDMAFQRGLWSAAVVNDKGERQSFSGNVHLLYRRQADGNWKLLTHTWN